MATSEKNTETAPDPEEDDLDDLDDLLDEFDEKPTITQPKPTIAAVPSASGPGRPSAATVEDAPAAEARGEKDLEAQLQAGMADMINQLGENPDMQKQFEEMMQELIAAGAAASDSEAAQHIRAANDAAPAHPDKKEDSFQDTIRKTMERMQQSGDAATAATTGSGAAGGSEDELLAQMMRELGAGGGAGGEEDFNKMLMSMMTQLTNKEILYEPMKELHDKFPAWLAANREKTAADDLQRYEEQRRLVTEIVGRFERNGYSDDNEDDREYIVERMQKMQAAGSPPPDLVGDMGAAQEALGELDSGCPTQ